MLKNVILSIVFFWSFWATAEAVIEGTKSDVKKLLSDFPKSITLEVSQEMTLESDRAKATFIIKAEEDQLSEAIETANKTFLQMAEKVKNFGISKVETSPYAIIPQFSFYKKSPSSFSVQKTFMVDLNSEEEFLKTLSVSEASEDVQFVKIEPIRSNLKEAKEKLELQCLSQLTKKKALYEKALNAKLVIESFFIKKPVQTTPQIQHRYISQSKTGSSLSNLSQPLIRNNFGKFKISFTLVAGYKLYPID